jgi:hypothetical protein
MTRSNAEETPFNRGILSGSAFSCYSTCMTKLLEQAVAKARALPEAEQNAIAQIVIDEIESERQWDALLAKSPEKLRKLADRAWAEHEAGDSQELDPDGL